ncbi:Sensor histidine kinase RcsC [compost metagenome]
MWNMATYDVLLTDVNMPKMNGYELTGELRARGYAQPIIGVTANAMRDEEARCMAAGMNSWLVKPIELSALRHHLGGITRVRVDMPDLPVASDVPEVLDVHDLPEVPAVPNVSDESPNEDAPPVPVDAAPEPLVPEKYRQLFLDTMDTDLANLDQAVTRRDVPVALQTMHRMRGALVMVKMTTLSSDFQAVEAKLRRDGGDDEVFQDVVRLTHELRNLLAQV